jgi:hypothetical protein
MMPRKLTEAQAEEIRAVVAARKALPTHAQLAKQFGVSKRVIDDIACGKAYKSPRETVTRLRDAMMELGLAKP